MTTETMDPVKGYVNRVRERISRVVGKSTSRIDLAVIRDLVSKLPVRYKEAIVLQAVTEMASEKVRLNQYRVEEAARRVRYEEAVRANKARLEREDKDRRDKKARQDREEEFRRRRNEEIRKVAQASKFEQLSVKWGPAKDHPEMAYTKLANEFYEKTGGWITFPINALDRKEFRKWMADAGHDLNVWIEKAKESVRKIGEGRYGRSVEEEIESVEADWYESGYMRYMDQKRMERLYAAARQLVEDTEKRVRLEVTEELLSSEFALGDGTVVSWGEATVEDHETRISILQANIAGNANTAALHLAAIRLIKKRKVSCLKETVDGGRA